MRELIERGDLELEVDDEVERSDLHRLLSREASADLAASNLEHINSASIDDSASASQQQAQQQGEVAQLLLHHPLTDRGLRLLEKHVPRDFWLPPLLRDPVLRRALGLTQLSVSHSHDHHDHVSLSVTSAAKSKTTISPPRRMRGSRSTADLGDRRKMAKA